VHLAVIHLPTLLVARLGSASERKNASIGVPDREANRLRRAAMQVQILIDQPLHAPARV